MEYAAMTQLRRLAQRQRGLFTYQDALRAGWHPASVRRWVSHGIWQEIAPRVYRFAGSTPTWQQELLAACLSSDAIAARRSACALFDLSPAPPVPELLVVRTRRNLDRRYIHSTTDLPPSDTTTVGGIPTTAPIRTLIDTAGTMSPAAVDDLVDRALLRHLVQPEELLLRAQELAAPARPGARRVLRSLATRHPDLHEARNLWEARVLRALDRAGLPAPVPNHPVVVGGRRRIIDFAWIAARVALEFDGYRPHMESRRVFDDDRTRQNDLIDAGWQVFRVTAPMLGRDAARHLAPLARAVSQDFRNRANIVGHSSVQCPSESAAVRRLWDTAS